MNIHEDTVTGEGVVTLTEYELHDVIADMLQNMFRPYLLDKLDGEMPLQIVIDVEHPYLFTPELKQAWEVRMNGLLRQIAVMDASYHDEAEHTC